MQQMWAHGMMGRDPDAVRGAKVDRTLIRRVWAFAKPYRAMLLGFLAIIVIEALEGLVPPILIKQIIDEAIPKHDSGLVTAFAVGMVGIGFLDAALSLAERWWSSRIGEGLIFDLRASLFDHTQRMPISFFTRTQTGALTSRLNMRTTRSSREMTSPANDMKATISPIVPSPRK